MGSKGRPTAGESEWASWASRESVSLSQLTSEAFGGKLTCISELWGDNVKVPQVTGACESTTTFKLLLSVCSPITPWFRAMRRQTTHVISTNKQTNKSQNIVQWPNKFSTYNMAGGKFGAVWARAYGIARMNTLGTAVFNCLEKPHSLSHSHPCWKDAMPAPVFSWAVPEVMLEMQGP